MARPFFRRLSGVITPLAAPTFTAQSAPAGSVSAAYSYIFVATPGTITYAVGTGALPPGLTLSSVGVLSGTPTTAATYTFTVVATNVSGSTSSISQSVVVTLPVPTFSSQTAPGGQVGSAYSYTFVAAPGTVTYALGTGSLPAGLTLSSGGVLSGTPTTATGYTFTVVATNATGSTSSSSQTVSITPVGATQVLFWDPAAYDLGGGATVQTGYNMKWDTVSRVNGGTYANSQFVSGANTSTATMTGLPTSVLIYATVVATDGTNESPAEFETSFTL